ncbi:MAG: hypothetical protein WB795_21440 [Candidatus Acidiferrales bacterium]
MTSADDETQKPGFPASQPTGVRWEWPATEPIIGPAAEADIRLIRQGDRRLAKRLVRSIGSLLDHPVSARSTLIPDPPGIGPRYASDLGKGFAAVCWVLQPPPEYSRSGPALWVERVVLWTNLRSALVAFGAQDE